MLDGIALMAEAQLIIQDLQLGSDFTDGTIVHHHQFLKLESLTGKVLRYLRKAFLFRKRSMCFPFHINTPTFVCNCCLMAWIVFYLCAGLEGFHCNLTDKPAGVVADQRIYCMLIYNPVFGRKTA